jgi:adenylate cyclase
VLLTAGVIALAVTLRIADPDPVARLRLSVFDTFLRASPRVADPNLPVRIVAVDEASLAKLGQWPWPRSDLAVIVDRLAAAGAKTISFDMILAEPDRMSPKELARQTQSRPELKPIISELEALPSNDARFAASIAKAPVILGLAGDSISSGALPKPPVRLATAGDEPKQFVHAFPGGVASLPMFWDGASGQGSVNWLPSSDQIVRRVPLLLSIGDALYPSLPLEALRVANGANTLFVRSSGGSGVLSFGERTGIDTIRVGETVLPSDAQGELWLNLAAPDPRRYISAYKVVDGTFDPKEVAGRHILIGASATGLLDLRATALQASVPGVEVHAQALEQMLSGQHLVRPALATGAELLFLVASGLGVASLIRRAGAVLAAVTAFAAILIVGGASWFLFRQAGYLFDPVYPSLALIAVYLTGSLLTYVKTETDRARIRNAFGHYVAAPVIDELARDPTKLKLGGETREVTLLFADVRGFSKLSEGMDAETLVRFVNRLFTPLAEVILDKRGTIDKFMGDAVMAFWNAPVSDPQHAKTACRAALAMQERLARHNREAVAEAPGGSARNVRIGIGLNTGPCCVGNVGSPQQFNYSVLGDVVNTASRIEGTTKIYGVPIIAGEGTANKADGFAFLEIETPALLRGKERPERLFALLGDEATATSIRFGELKARYGELCAAMRAGDAAETSRRIDACRALGWPEIKGLLDHYAARPATSG